MGAAGDTGVVAPPPAVGGIAAAPATGGLGVEHAGGCGWATPPTHMTFSPPSGHRRASTDAVQALSSSTFALAHRLISHFGAMREPWH
jgi:hypothetical protein